MGGDYDFLVGAVVTLVSVGFAWFLMIRIWPGVHCGGHGGSGGGSGSGGRPHVIVNNYSGMSPMFVPVDDDDDGDGGDDPPAADPPSEPHGAELEMSQMTFDQLMGRLWNPAVMGN